MVTLSPRALAHATRRGRDMGSRHYDTQSWLIQESLYVYRDTGHRLAWVVAAEAAANAARAERRAADAAREAAFQARYANDPTDDPMEESWRRWCAMGQDDDDAET